MHRVGAGKEANNVLGAEIPAYECGRRAGYYNESQTV